MQTDPTRSSGPAVPSATVAARLGRLAREARGLGRTFTIGVSLVLAGLLVLGGLAWQGTRHLQLDMLIVQRGQLALTALARLRATVAEAEAALQGASRSADPEALVPFREAKLQAAQQLAELRSALAADNEQFNRVVALGALLTQRFDALAATLQVPRARLRELPRTAGAGDDARLHDGVQAAIAELRGQAQADLAAAQASSGPDATRALVAIASSSALAVVVLGFGGWRLVVDRARAVRARSLEQAAEAQRRLSDQALQRVFDASFDALGLIDAEGRMVRTGAAWERLWGWPAEALSGRPYTDLVMSEDHRKTEQAAAPALEGTAPAEFRSRGRQRDGGTLELLWRLQVLDEDRPRLAWVRDLSELESLRAEGLRRDQELQACRAELARAQDQAARSARLRADFMTHFGAGLRSSAAAIVSLAGILQQGLAGPLNAEQHRELSKLLETARSLGARIDALLDLALIDGNQLKIKHEAFDMLEAVQRVATDMRAAAERKSLDFECQLADTLGYARGDAARVEQVLRALIQHAIRSTTAGKIRLQAGTPTGGLICIAVSDDGPGVAPEAIAGLFDPYRGGGAGLGLALAQKLAALMGGRISVSHAPGPGTTLTLKLPADPMQEG